MGPYATYVAATKASCVPTRRYSSAKTSPTFSPRRRPSASTTLLDHRSRWALRIGPPSQRKCTPVTGTACSCGAWNGLHATRYFSWRKSHRFVNDWLGRVIGVLTLTPYDFWRRGHGIHHATSGNLDRRGSERLSRKLRDLLKDCVAGEYISDWAKEQFPSEWENKRNFVASRFVKSK